MLSPLTLLILINCLPLYFVVGFGWDAGELIRLYWAENLVIGFYYILKLICARVDNTAANLGKLFMVPFFMVHFGGFCAVHGIFVMLLTSGTGAADGAVNANAASIWLGPFVFIGLVINVAWYYLHNAAPDELFMVKALFVSHGFSFYVNFIRNGEWKTAKLGDLMSAPYKRIVLLHVVILAGAVPVMMLKSPVPMVLMLIVIKIIMDIKLHRKSHEKEEMESA